MQRVCRARVSRTEILIGFRDTRNRKISKIDFSYDALASGARIVYARFVVPLRIENVSLERRRGSDVNEKNVSVASRRLKGARSLRESHWSFERKLRNGKESRTRGLGKRFRPFATAAGDGLTGNDATCSAGSRRRRKSKFALVVALIIATCLREESIDSLEDDIDF